MEMTKKELVSICSVYLEETKKETNKCPKEFLDFLYWEEILPAAIESNGTSFDLH